MRVIGLAVVCAIIIPTVAFAGTVYSRAWCKHPEHGKSAGGRYGWITDVFEGNNADACWRAAREHSDPKNGHVTGCGYVNSSGEYGRE